jgi:hypothetical protein
MYVKFSAQTCLKKTTTNTKFWSARVRIIIICLRLQECQWSGEVSTGRGVAKLEFGASLFGHYAPPAAHRGSLKFEWPPRGGGTMQKMKILLLFLGL